MKLQEILDQLGAGEFSQLAIGGQEPGVFNEANYKNIVNHVNLALTTLYSRFHLKEGRIELTLNASRLVYPITSAFAVNNKRSQEPLRYLKDTAAAPFQDDIHKITAVLTENGLAMPLNDHSKPLSCTTPSMTTLSVPDLVVHPIPSQTPYWARTSSLMVVYRANHPIIKIPMGLFDPTRVNVELPYSHLQALLYFVASRVNNPVGMTNEFHAGNNYAAKYEAACQELEHAGMQVDQLGGNTKLRQKGFP